MNEILDTWYRETQSRRRVSVRALPLAPSLLGGLKPDARTSVAAARAVLESLGRRSIQLALEPGGSRANLETGEVNLDAEILDLSAPWSERIEALIGVAAHEAAHFLWTPLEKNPRDAIFRAVQNMLEDERIEARLARSRPSLVHPLHVARRELLRAGDAKANFLSAVFTLVRCEESIRPELWTRYEDRLRVVIEALTPFPQTFAEMRFASLAIVLQVPTNELDQLPDPDLWGWPSSVHGRSSGSLAERHRRERLRRRQRRLRDELLGLRGRHEGSRGGSWPPVFWSTVEDDRAGYERVRTDVAARARVLADRIRSLLPARRVSRQSSGRLDRKRLYASSYSPRVFRSPGGPPPALSIAILIDLSGSMGGRSERIAQQVAVLVSEATRALPEVQLAVYGHTADLDGEASTQMVRFPLDAEGRPTGLGRMPVLANNRDAHALRELGHELLGSPLRSSRHRLAIVIADGRPSATDFGGAEAIEQTREAIEWLDHAWGPVLFVATDQIERLRTMVPGASFRFRAGDAVEELSHYLTLTLKRSQRGSR